MNLLQRMKSMAGSMRGLDLAMGDDRDDADDADEEDIYSLAAKAAAAATATAAPTTPVAAAAAVNSVPASLASPGRIEEGEEDDDEDDDDDDDDDGEGDGGGGGGGDDGDTFDEGASLIPVLQDVPAKRSDRRLQDQVAEANQREEDRVLREQTAAKVAILACEVPHKAIQIGVANAVKALRRKSRHVSLINFNFMRGREMNKIQQQHHDEISSSKDVYNQDGELNSYMLNYSYKAFDLFQRVVNNKLESFEHIKEIDFNAQYLGDDRFILLCEAIARCPVQVLNLSTNKITDAGLVKFTKIFRSLYKLKSLNLSGNAFSDDGVKILFQNDVYSPTLESLDLCRNELTLKSAYFIGYLFHKTTSLHTLHLGGRVGEKSWGDDFLYVLIYIWMLPGAKPVRNLSISDFNLSPSGICALGTFLMCRNSLEWINLTRNSFVTESCKIYFAHCLSINQSMRSLVLGQCGLTRAEKQKFVEVMGKNYTLKWEESSLLSVIAAKELLNCSRYHYRVELSLFNTWDKECPPSFPDIMTFVNKYQHDPILTEEVIGTLPVPIQGSILGCNLIYHFNKYLDIVIDDAEKLLQTSKVQVPREISELGINLIHKRARNVIFHSVLKVVSNRYSGFVDVMNSKINRTKWPNLFKPLNIEIVHMCIEDYRSSLYEVNVVSEFDIAKLFHLFLTRDDPEATESLLKIIPHFSKVGLASVYIQYLYLYHPIEKEIQLKEHLAAEKKKMKQMAAAAKKMRKFRSRQEPLKGPRFTITPSASAAVRRTDASGQTYSFANKSTKFAESMKMRAQELKATAGSGGIDAKSEVTLGSDPSTTNNSSNSSVAEMSKHIDPINEDEEGEDGGEVGRIPVKVGTLQLMDVPVLSKKHAVMKTDLIERYTSLSNEDLNDETCVYSMARGSRLYTVGCFREFPMVMDPHLTTPSRAVSTKRMFSNSSLKNKIKSVKSLSRMRSLENMPKDDANFDPECYYTPTNFLGEEELSRGQPLVSLKFINVVRPDIRLKTHMKIEKENHILLRQKEFRM